MIATQTLASIPRHNVYATLSALLTLIASCIATPSSATASTLGPITIKGYKFFDSVTGDEFVVKGIDYFPRPNQGKYNHNSADLFTDDHREVWERDVKYLKELGVNTVRLYAVDPLQSHHDEFMCALNEAGIYVIVALAHDCPTCAVTRDETPECYPVELKKQGQQVINAFAKYPNTLAFSAGNEVNHFSPLNMPEWNAPCQKKFLRDMRAYIDSCEHMRKVPVGVVSADDFRDDLAKYYNCQGGNDPYESADWYGLNSYVFCNGKVKTYEEAEGFKLLELSFKSYNYSIPVILTEFGCLSETFPKVGDFEAQRNFLTAKWMLEEPALREQFSGGVVFEYSIEMENAKSESPYPFHKFGHQNYGIGYFGPENCDDVDTPCEYHPMPSFDMLKEHYTKSEAIDLARLDSFTATSDRIQRSECPSRFPNLSEFDWKADTVEDLECPAAGQASSFTCPASYKPKIVAVPVGGTSKGLEAGSEVNGQSSLYKFFVCLFALLVLAIFSLVWAYYRERRGQIVPEWLVETNKNIRRTSQTIIRAGNDSDSEESASLLSMKPYQNNGEPDYRAIESDSSSEDLRKYEKNTLYV